VPLGIIGAVAALLLSGNTFSFVAIIGLIALIGIEVQKFNIASGLYRSAA